MYTFMKLGECESLASFVSCINFGNFDTIVLSKNASIEHVDEVLNDTY